MSHIENLVKVIEFIIDKKDIGNPGRKKENKKHIMIMM
jgi:hypothetical protein